MAQYFLQLAGSFFAFPLWWYGQGFMETTRSIGRVLAFRVKSYGFVLWMQNLLVPMYGQYDLAGRVVSVVMRFVVLFGRALALLAEALAYALLLMLWLLAPPLALFGLLWNLIS